MIGGGVTRFYDKGKIVCSLHTDLVRFKFMIGLTTHRSEKSPIPAKRIQNIIEFLTYEVFKYSCRGLYENHKFLFTLLLALKIDIQGGKVKVQEFQTLIKGKKMLILFIILGPVVQRVYCAIH